MGQLRVLNPDPSEYSKDNCPSLAEANNGLRLDSVDDAQLTTRPFDWDAFVKRDPTTISRYEWIKAYRMSAGWVTCACGNQCVVIPRHYSGMPKDGTLRRLGLGFCNAIEDKNLDKAADLLAEIEARSAHLIAEIYDTGGVSTK